MVKVYFATNRIPTGDRDIFGDDALPDRPGNLSIGTASVSLTRATAGRAENKLAHADQVHDVVVYPRTRQDDHQRTAGSSRLVRELTKSIIDGGKDLLIYIHGYDTNFREAVWYGGQIKLQYNRVLEVRRNDLRQYGGWPSNGIEVLVLSWPSAGRALAYPIEFLRLKREKWHLSATTLLHELEQTLDDQTRAVQAAIGDERIDDLERRLAEGSLQLPGRIHLLAQSMGARILGHGLSAYVERLRVAGPVEQLVQSAILTGADVDSDAFAASGPLRDQSESRRPDGPAEADGRRSNGSWSS